MPTVPKPRYQFCWWCDLRLRGRHHRRVRATTALANPEPVIVHHACADEMLAEDGWELVAENDNAPGARLRIN